MRGRGEARPDWWGGGECPPGEGERGERGEGGDVIWMGELGVSILMVFGKRMRRGLG